MKLINWYRKFWKGLSEITDITADEGKHVIVKTINAANDVLVTILSKLLPFLAPLPSAINLYDVLVKSHGYEIWKAGVAALVIEFLAFVLAEKAVSKIMDNARTREKVFMGTLLGAYYIALFAIIVFLEIFMHASPNWTALMFPVLSVIATLAYGYMQWDEKTAAQKERNISEEIEDAREETEAEWNALLQDMEKDNIAVITNLQEQNNALNIALKELRNNAPKNMQPARNNADTEIAILQAIQNHDARTQADIADYAQVNSSTVSRKLKTMLEENKLIKLGHGKGYEIDATFAASLNGQLSKVVQ